MVQFSHRSSESAGEDDPPPLIENESDPPPTLEHYLLAPSDILLPETKKEPEGALSTRELLHADYAGENEMDESAYMAPASGQPPLEGVRDIARFLLAYTLNKVENDPWVYITRDDEDAGEIHSALKLFFAQRTAVPEGESEEMGDTNQRFRYAA